MTIEAPQVPCVGTTETVNAAVSFVGRLDSGELLTGTPTVLELSTSDLTIDNKAVSTGALTINGQSVVTGAAVQFRFTGQQAGTSYRIRVTCGTDSTPAATRTGIVSFIAVADTV